MKTTEVFVTECHGIAERLIGAPDSGTIFPYGPRDIKYPHLDGHRAAYTDADAQAVVEMVNGSSWITRKGR